MLVPGDSEVMGHATKIIIDSVDQEPAPRRMVLGSDAWGIIQEALADRLAAVHSQQELARIN